MKRGMFAIMSSLVILTAIQLRAPMQASTTFTVNTTTSADDGACSAAHCSLHETINAANGSPELDTIAFNLPSPYTISLTDHELPTITNPIILDGTTQPGYAGKPIVEIVGHQRDGYEHSALMLMSGASGSTIRGLAINGHDTAIFINDADNNLIERNYLGMTLDGQTPKAVNWGVIVRGGQGNQIGRPGGGNLIASERRSIWLLHNGDGDRPRNNRVQGNFIGSDSTGSRIVWATGAFSWNTCGVSIDYGSANTIGGTQQGMGNLIMGQGKGICITGAHGNIVQGNVVGLDITGTKAAGNGGAGIYIFYSARNLIGGTAPGAGNVISGNTGDGVYIIGWESDETQIYGNIIGADKSGRVSIGNGGNGVLAVNVAAPNGVLVGGTLAQANIIAFNYKTGIAIQGGRGEIGINSVSGNRGLGIDLLYSTGEFEGVTPNDTGDADGILNYPVLTSALFDGSTVLISGTLHSKPGYSFSIAFYDNAACDASGYGEGQVYLGAVAVTTDGSGNASFSMQFPAVNDQTFISAITTDHSGRPSEFSSCIDVTAGGPNPTPSAPPATPQPTATPLPSGSLSAPVLIAPANGASTSPKPTFEWQPVMNAVRYRLYLSENADFSSLISNQSVTTTSYTRTYSLTAGKTYYWRVRAINAAGSSGPWSAVWSFTVSAAAPTSVPTAMPTAAPATVTPTQSGCPTAVPSGVTARRHTPQSDPRTLLLEWEDLSAACEAVQSYKVYVWRGTYKQEWVFNRDAIACNSVICTATISFSTTQSSIYWRVAAINVLGEGVSDNSKSYTIP